MNTPDFPAGGPSAGARAIPLAVVDPAPAAPLQPGVRQVAGDKIARSPVQFADAPVLREHPEVKWTL